jgi:DNA-binding response OmpR family regulator
MRGDSAEVMQLLLTARFGTVFLDNWMPKINGIELRRLIRSLDKKLPIFFCSGAVTEGDKKAAFDAHAQDYFGKPFDPEELTTTFTRRREHPTDLTHLFRLSLYLTDSAITPIHFQSTDCQRSCIQGFLP